MSVEPETRAATATDTDTNNHNTIARKNNVDDGEGKKQAFGRGVGDGRQWDEFLIGARGGDQVRLRPPASVPAISCIIFFIRVYVCVYDRGHLVLSSDDYVFV